MEVKLHDIGEGMTEAEINCFLVKPGEAVKADDPLVEVQTDKMTAEIPAPRAGIIKEFTVQPGDTVSVGSTLLILEVGEQAGVPVKIEKNLPKPAVAELQAERLQSFAAVKRKRVLASPFTRKIARENGITIENVAGTGPAGRILDEDIYKFMAAAQQKPKLPAQPAPKEPAKRNDKVTSTIPLRGRRKQIAKKMVHSLNTIPHCTHFEEIDVTELITFRNELKDQNQTISATAFFLKALSICLKEFPVFNAELDEEKEAIHLLKDHHIGIAVDTEEGLIVPVIQNIEKKSIRDIHKEMKQLTDKALENMLTVKEITGGTFTISNVGPLGGSFGATPIIQHPQTALVSFHKTKKMPVVTEDDQIVIRSMMNISMSFDHRVADGATAVRFTNRFAELIQNPKMLVLEMV
ncbi:dihydrolipoamide acetyltransferase family protein [Aeromicrobium ponti]|uniref:Dihydrolipoamide acetyltransferase component of pyruvate dehydrogenase complex n=1 Tax=Cytobacillus oceanisediminis TaxID=665099 RepID=A0A562JU38_9BACI|nr:dihydrolipoamide acetyltransferase family protein [Cytobacillus oceanisediminis]TWH86668.1 pyruvate dehydrogenase E2 component (dihydrolipoamide acetyltransferase) [Cytobacillus oceanisediminis]